MDTNEERREGGGVSNFSYVSRVSRLKVAYPRVYQGPYALIPFLWDASDAQHSLHDNVGSESC